MTTYVISVGVADVRSDHDPNSELVTQALMNAPAKLGENVDEWTFVTLADYEGWVRSDELEQPVVKGFCKVGESCGTPLHLIAVIRATRTPLYSHTEGDNTFGYIYLSTTLPLLDITQASLSLIHI